MAIVQTNLDFYSGLLKHKENAINNFLTALKNKGTETISHDFSITNNDGHGLKSKISLLKKQIDEISYIISSITSIKANKNYIVNYKQTDNSQKTYSQLIHITDKKSVKLMTTFSGLYFLNCKKNV